MNSFDVALQREIREGLYPELLDVILEDEESALDNIGPSSPAKTLGRSPPLTRTKMLSALPAITNFCPTTTPTDSLVAVRAVAADMRSKPR